MCLAIPAKVLMVQGAIATVDFGDGTLREVNVSLVDAPVGGFIIVHAGFAIEVLDRAEAEETLTVWRDLLRRDVAG